MKGFKCSQENISQILSYRGFLLASFGLLLSLFLASSVSISSASAANYYDKAVRPTTQVSLINGTHNVNITDLTGDVYYKDLIQESQCSATTKSNIENSIKTGNFALSQSKYENPSQPRGTQWALFWYNLNPEQGVMSFAGNDAPPFQALTYPSLLTGSGLIYIDSNGNIQVRCGTAGTDYGNWASTNDSWITGEQAYIYYSSFAITYPDGYEGLSVPTQEGGSSKKVIKPDYKYQVNYKELTLTPAQKELPELTTDPGYTTEGYQLEYSFFHCKDGFSGQPEYSCKGSEIMQKYYKIQPVDQEYKLTFDDLGEYRVNVQYVAKQCYRYPSYPATPDNCFFYALNNVFPTYLFTSTGKDLDVNGTSFTGNTATEQCDVSGFCTVPQSGFDAYKILNSLDIETNGLQEVVLAPLDFISQLSSQQCIPLSLPMPNGIPAILMPCMTPIYQQHFGQILLIYQTIISGLFAYYVSIRAFGNVKEIVNPRDDQIDTVKL